MENIRIWFPKSKSKKSKSKKKTSWAVVVHLRLRSRLQQQSGFLFLLNYNSNKLVLTLKFPSTLFISSWLASYSLGRKIRQLKHSWCWPPTWTPGFSFLWEKATTIPQNEEFWKAKADPYNATTVYMKHFQINFINLFSCWCLNNRQSCFSLLFFVWCF